MTSKLSNEIAKLAFALIYANIDKYVKITNKMERIMMQILHELASEKPELFKKCFNSKSCDENLPTLLMLATITAVDEGIDKGKKQLERLIRMFI